MTPPITQCPMCGWTGNESDFEADGTDRNCPACQYTLKQV